MTSPTHTGLRAIHRIHAPQSVAHDVSAYLDRTSDGALEAVAYVSADGDHYVVLEHWADQETYSTWWTGDRSAEARRALDRLRGPTPATPSEFYRHQTFRLDDGWTANSVGATRPAIVWPGRGPVRVVVQVGLTDSTDTQTALRADEAATRPEPGCRQYEWFTSTDTDNGCLLLELWSSQALYDRHWHLRTRTGSASAGALPLTPRTRGDGGIEFYRHQAFSSLDDHWLPIDSDARSETITWAD